MSAAGRGCRCANGPRRHVAPSARLYGVTKEATYAGNEVAIAMGNEEWWWIDYPEIMGMTRANQREERLTRIIT